MKFFKLAVMSLLAAVAAISFADNSPAASTPSATSAPATAAALSPQDEKLKKLVEQRLGEGAKVDTVTKTNYMGLYEVKVGDEILYTDEQAKYLMVGHVVDLETHKDLTSARLNEINKINFADLPFDSSIKMVHGNGKRVIAVFEDPNCHFCKNMRHTLASMDNVTVYTFMYNILAPDSFVKSKNIWCTTDRAKSWDDWMLNGKVAASAPATCKTNPNDQILALGQKLHITGTPTIFFADGTRSPGALSAKELEDKWATVQ
jgi:thiol:disulfide interchange protein DsbC